MFWRRLKILCLYIALGRRDNERIEHCQAGAEQADDKIKKQAQGVLNAGFIDHALNGVCHREKRKCAEKQRRIPQQTQKQKQSIVGEARIRHAAGHIQDKNRKRESGCGNNAVPYKAGNNPAAFNYLFPVFFMRRLYIPAIRFIHKKPVIRNIPYIALAIPYVLGYHVLPV